ncbi:MAG: Fe2+-dependent dioxygenase [Gammaproteobacteria bacterium]|nr:Fe2+-dependent dioxygenase [Gammaproteobacteria bacterium]MCP5135671.1 Fe2+-dependent dioxygenase [Gammaproteobacteria bacterium]
MLLTLRKVLSQDDLAELHRIIQAGQAADGRLTAGKAAAQVKKNEEMQFSDNQRLNINRLLMQRLGANADFRNATFPLRVADPIIARYIPGMAYGEHIDDPIMGSGQKFRTDVSMTIFLSEPGTYEGGDLIAETPFGRQTVKLPAGDAVIYPSGSLHQVGEVTAGERLVAVAWIQSMIRDPQRRQLLYELNLAREKLMVISPGNSETRQVDHAYINLVRMWAEL